MAAVRPCKSFYSSCSVSSLGQVTSSLLCYLQPSLATFNDMKIFFGEWRLYIYLRPSLAITININTSTLILSYHNFICFHPTPASIVAGSESDTTDIFGLVCPVCGNQSQACPGETVTNEVYSVVSSSLCTMPTPSSGNMLTTGCPR